MKYKSLALILLVFFTFIFGLYLGSLLEKYLSPDENFAVKVVRIKGAKYTSPILYTDTPAENGPFIKGLHDSLNSYIATATQKGLANNISVYVRYPYLSDWTIINGSEKYSPASLLKVPLMMVYYQKSEFDPMLFSKTLTYNIPDQDQMMNYKPKEVLEKGKTYTIDDLIRRMIVYSDDNAESMLESVVSQKEFGQIFDDLQVNSFDFAHQENSMDVQTYSYFFRVLYNATFLNRQISEKALQLLSQTTFTQGIVAGVPNNIMVAHKFGERYVVDIGSRQLHDCGIVYYPKNPYLLCIMTRGKSFADLQTVLKNISSLTYNYTNEQNH